MTTTRPTRRIRLTKLQKRVLRTLRQSGQETIATVYTAERVQPAATRESMQSAISELLRLGYIRREEDTLIVTPLGSARLGRKRRFWLGFALGLVLPFVLLCLPSFFPARPRTHSPALPSEIAEAGGLRVAVGGPLGRTVVFTRGTEEFRTRIPDWEYWRSPAVSPDGRSAWLLTASKMNLDYECLMRFDFGNASLTPAESRRFLRPSQLPAFTGGKRAFVGQIYRPSADGRRVLLRVYFDNIIFQGDPDTALASGIHWRDQPYWYDIDHNTLQPPE